MTKSEKKEIIKRLILDIEETTNTEDYALKRSQLFDEVLSAGYPAERLPNVVQAANTWCKDFDMNMEAKLSNQNPLNSKQFIAMSATGLLTLIDTSLLPD
jgi:hypothetical protein